MATLTSTVYANNPVKSVHKGQVTVAGQWVATAAGSSGDVVLLAKLPH